MARALPGTKPMSLPTTQMNVTCKKGGLRTTRHTFGGSSKPVWGKPTIRPSAGRRNHWAKRLPSTLRGPLPCFAAIGVFYSTSTGHTEDIAGIIKTELGDAASDPQDIGDIKLSKLDEYDSLVVGAPTWNTGADTERSGTAWDNLLEDIKGLDLSSKKVAVFGLGDSMSYGDYFCDAAEEIYTLFKGTGAKMIGHWPTDGYQHEDSKALINGGSHFCGLLLDEDNEDDKSEPRIKEWVKQLKDEGIN